MGVVADRFMVLAGVLAMATPVFAAKGGPDAFGYRWADQSEVGVDTSVPSPTTSMTVLPLGNESVSAPIDLGFSMPFYGGSYSKFVIADNGWLSFDTALTNPYPSNTTIPATAPPNFMIAWYWRDLAAPFQIAHAPFAQGYLVNIITSPPGQPPSIGIYVIFYNTGFIKVVYQAVDQESSVSVGIENGSGSDGLNPWYRGTGSNGFILASDTAIVYSPPAQLDCSAAIPVGCGTTSSSSPAAVSRNVAAYACSLDGYQGRERVFDFTNPTLSDVTFSLANVTPGIDLDLFVLRRGECSEFACLGGGGDTLTLPLLAKGSYRVVVDGKKATDNGNFDLRIGCTPRATILGCQPPGSPPVPGVTNGLSQWSTYPCSNQTLDGPEVIYEIPFTAPGNLKAVLSHDPAEELDLVAFGPDSFAAPDGCGTWGDENLTLYNPPSGVYYVMVEGRNAAAGAYTLGVTCDVLLNCASPAGSLTCFQETAGTTRGSLNRAEQYSCNPDLFTGGETLYSFRNDTRRTVSFLLEGPPDLAMFLVSACNEGACLATGTNRLVARDLPIGDYLLVVDGRSGATGDFKLTPFCGNRVIPDQLSVVLDPGQSVHETKTLWVNADITRGDVLFDVDTTSSISPSIRNIASSANQIIAELSRVIEDVQFGVVSFEDYPGTYNTCGYNGGYGGGSDRPYRLNLAVTNNQPLLNSTILGLRPTGGGDDPESYLRVWYEMYADATKIGWRPGARRLVVMFGDERPHVCAAASLGCTTETNGVDPGRDGAAGTADDLAMGPVMAELKRQGITPIFAAVNSNVLTLWDCYTKFGGGRAYDAPNGALPPTLVADLRLLIEQKSLRCDVLEARPSAGYESWVKNVMPTSYNTDLPARVTFDFDIVPPVGAPAGIHNFQIDMVCDGVVKVSQAVTLEVTGSCGATPKVAASGSTCAGQARQLSAQASTMTGCTGQVEFQWKDALGVLVDPPGPFSPANVVLDIVPAASTTYTLEMRCSDTVGCPTIGSKIIPVDVDPAPAADAGPDRTVCIGETTRLGTPAVAGMTYDWAPVNDLSNPFLAEPDFTTLGPVGRRNFVVTVTDSVTGCTSTSRVEIDVTLRAPAGRVGNTLLMVKRGGDAELTWSAGALSPRTYNVHREDQKPSLTLPLPRAPLAPITALEGYTDGGIVPPLPDRRFYQVYGRDCAGASIFN